MPITKPMLAAKLTDLAHLRYPLLVTPKIDGIRCLKLEGRAWTRAFKPVQNQHIREWVERNLPDGIDGEIVASPNSEDSFQLTQSAVMTRDGRPDFQFHAFDWVQDGALFVPYRTRAFNLCELTIPNLEVLVPTMVESEKQFLIMEELYLSQGYEGIMARSPDSPYKCGRSSLRESYLLKFKRYTTSEAVILGFEEAKENQNPIVRNAFGRATRPGGKDLKVPKGTLGGFLVRDIYSGIEFSIGTGKGLTQAFRQSIWDNQPQYLGSVITYSFQDVGTKDRPRFPSFLGFRKEYDATSLPCD